MSKDKELELIVYHVYSAKRPRRCGFLGDYMNDRMILHIGAFTVQYDSPTVKFGGKYPTISKEKFLKWAKADVTKETPEGGWRLVKTL